MKRAGLAAFLLFALVVAGGVAIAYAIGDDDLFGSNP